MAPPKIDASRRSWSARLSRGSAPAEGHPLARYELEKLGREEKLLGLVRATLGGTHIRARVVVARAERALLRIDHVAAQAREKRPAIRRRLPRESPGEPSSLVKPPAVGAARGFLLRIAQPTGRRQSDERQSYSVVRSLGYVAPLSTPRVRGSTSDVTSTNRHPGSRRSESAGGRTCDSKRRSEQPNDA